MLDKGRYISDRYEIIQKIGSGGMSEVYQAKDHTLNRDVAIKILKDEFANDENFVAKFKTEAQSAASLSHPNIVNVYDVGSDSGMNYIVMEYIEGITLKTYIEKKGRLSFKEADSIAIQVAKGIEDAHRHHVVHRDIKPQNIMISTDGKVKVMDFGIARAASAETVKSEVMGSVHYISPEQARNGFVDGKSDIYSLGIVMYEMVTGRVPFDSDTTVAVAVAHLQEEMVHPSVYVPDLPVSMEGIILKCTQKNPDMRYQDTEELLADLKKALMNPDEDFVVIPHVQTAKTMVVSQDELNLINTRAPGAADPDDQSNGYEDQYGNVQGRSQNTSYYDTPQEDDEETDDDSGFLNPKMEKAVTIGGIIAGIVIIIVLILFVGNVLGWFRSGSSTKEDTTQEEEGKVTVPDVRGMTYDEAKELLTKEGLEISQFAREYSDEYEKGQIISQDPDSDEMVDEGSTVTVVVSKGSQSETDTAQQSSVVPDVAGMEENAAKASLEQAGLEVGSTTYTYSDTVDEGVVISTDPSAGSTVTDGMSIVMTVSRGKKTVSVPSVTGKTQSDAEKLLKNSNLAVGSVTREYSDSVAEGKVIRQSLVAGSTVQENTAVDLTVSLGPEVKYVVVPDVLGSTLQKAQRMLNNKGLELGAVDYAYSDSVAEGCVISQGIAAGRSIEEGSSVSVVISKGPQETVTTSPTVTTTPEEDIVE